MSMQTAMMRRALKAAGELITAGGPGSGRHASGVHVDHSNYVNTHGKSPSGHGGWAFSPVKSGHAGDPMFWHTGKYSEAKQKAKQWGADNGHDVLHVQT